MKKIVISWLVCVLGLVALFAWAGKDIFPTIGSTDTGVSTASPGLIKGQFTLVNAAGKTVTQKDFHGKYTLVFFGFTHCPEVCPTTLLLIENTLGKLGEQGKKVQPIFISIDPERDTPKVAGEYAAHFGNTIGLSGNAAQVKQAADNFKVYYSKVEMSDPSMGYMMNHSSFLYLMGPDGKFITYFANDVSPRDLEDGLRKNIR